MTKPPTFTECTICGREFGSKSIVIHERQCLQKLRRTEILESESHGTRQPKKKSSSTAKSESNSQKSVIVTSISPELINLPKIPTKSPTASKSESGANAKDKSLYNLRPTTATLARPQILNPDYIQYDMSLTRIDYSTLQPKVMDENQNNRNGNRQSDDMNRSSKVILPAVTGVSAPTFKTGKQYKGVDSECKITKLPESALTSLLGDPIKKYVGLSDDSILPRYTDTFQIPNCSNSSKSFPIPLPSLSTESSLKKAENYLSEHDEKYNLPKITNARTSDESNQDNFNLVTPGYSTSINLPLSTPNGGKTNPSTKGVYGLEEVKDEESSESGSEYQKRKHFHSDSTLTITTSDVHRRIYEIRSSEQNSASKGRNLQWEPEEKSPESPLELILTSPEKSFEEIIVLKDIQLKMRNFSSSESEDSVKMLEVPPQIKRFMRRKSYRLANPLPPHSYYQNLLRQTGLSDSDSSSDSEDELSSVESGSEDHYTTADSGDSSQCSSHEGSLKDYYVREPLVQEFEIESNSGSSDSIVETVDQKKDDYEIVRYFSAPSILQAYENCTVFGNQEANNQEEKVESNLHAQPPVNTVSTIPTLTPPKYSNVPDPLPQVHPAEYLFYHSDDESEEEPGVVRYSVPALKSILKKPSTTETQVETPVPVTRGSRQFLKDNTFTGSDSDDEGSCNKSLTQLLSARSNVFRKRSRAQTLRSISAHHIETQSMVGFDSAETDAAPPLHPVQDESLTQSSPLTEPISGNLLEELTELLGRELSVKIEESKNSRRARSISRGSRLVSFPGKRFDEQAQQKVNEWLETCETDADEVKIWEGIPEGDRETNSLRSYSSDDSLLDHKFIQHSTVDDSISAKEEIIADLLSKLSHVRVVKEGKKLNGEKKIKVVEQLKSGPDSEKLRKRKCLTIIASSKPEAGLKSRVKSGDKRKITSPKLDMKTLQIIKRISERSNSTRPLSANQQLTRPQTSPPIPSLGIPKKWMRPPTPQTPLASMKQTLAGIKIGRKSPVQTKVKSCQVPERRSVYCQSSPPLKAVKKRNPKKSAIQKENGTKKVDKEKLLSPVKPCIRNLDSAFTRLEHKTKLERLVRFSDNFRSDPSSNNNEDIPLALDSKPCYIPSFEENKNKWVEFTSTPTHLVYQFQAVQNSGSSATNDEAQNSQRSGEGVPSSDCIPEGRRKSEALKALESMEDQKNSMREREYEKKRRQQIGRGRKFTERASVFPSLYSLMVPKSPGPQQYVNLHIIIRRKGPKGNLPAVEDIVPQYSTEEMYLIVDEEALTSTSPNPYFLAQATHETVAKPVDNTLDDDVYTPKIVTSGRESIDGLSENEAESRHLTCYICGKEYNCRALRPHEKTCKREFIQRNTNLDEKYRRVLNPKPKGTVTIRRWNEFALDSTKYKYITCPLCNLSFLPDRKDKINEHMETCQKALLELVTKGDKPSLQIVNGSPEIVIPDQIDLKYRKTGAGHDFDAASNVETGKRFKPYRKPKKVKG